MRKRQRRGSGRSIQKKTQLRRHKRSVLGVSLVLILLMIILFAGSISLHTKSKIYDGQVAELQTQIKSEKNRTSEIDKMKEYIKTDEYVREMAQERLGLVDPDEIIFKPAE